MRPDSVCTDFGAIYVVYLLTYLLTYLITYLLTYIIILYIIESLVAIPLTPKYMTLNDFEWLEWPFYVKFLLFRTALSASRLHTYRSLFTHVTSGDVRMCGSEPRSADYLESAKKLRICRRHYIVGTLPIMPTLLLFSITWLLLNL